MTEQSIVAIALDDPDQFSVLTDIAIFLDGLETPETNFVATLSGETQLTVFAPTNEAFGELAATLGFGGDVDDASAVSSFFTGLAEVLPQTVIDILSYHVLVGANGAATLDGLSEVETFGGGFIDLSRFDPFGTGSTELVDLVLGVENPSVIAADLPASNGIIHVIDKVLLPSGVVPSITGLVLDNPDLRILLDVVLYLDSPEGGNAGLAALLDTEGANLTVFAPTNAAFATLAQELGFDGVIADVNDLTDAEIEAVSGFFSDAANIDPSLLLSVVQYHVLPDTRTESDIVNDEDGTLETVLPGATIGTGNLPALTDLEDDLDDPTLIATDVPASNGIVHTIDRVLLPSNDIAFDVVEKVVALSGETGFDTDGGDFDFLRTAVEAAGLDDALGTLDVTVFAPTDAAFMGVTKALGFEGDDEAEGFEYLVDALRLLNQGNDPTELLSDILLYHVSAGGKTLSEVAAAGSVTTLLDSDISVDGLSLVDADPDLPNPNLVLTDVGVTNGVIHAIDGVLFPLDILQSDGSNDVDFEIGGRGRDFFSTGKDNDFIDAKGGRDKVYAGAGDDVVLAGSGRDFVSGGSGNDIIKGEGGRDDLIGGLGNDMIDGGKGRDWITGGLGDDTLAGGKGDDWLSGGFGEDTFVFEENGGHDTISFFWKGQDKIDLSAFGFSDFDEIDIDRKGLFRSEIDLDDTVITVNHFFFGLSESDFIL